MSIITILPARGRNGHFGLPRFNRKSATAHERHFPGHLKSEGSGELTGYSVVAVTITDDTESL